MAWATPSSRSVGTLISNTIWNQDVVDNTQFLYDRRYRVLHYLVPWTSVSSLNVNWNTRSSLSGLWLGGYITNSGNLNDEITYKFYMEPTASAALAFFYRKYNSYGIATITFDGVNIGTIDGYAASQTAAETAFTSLSVSDPGFVDLNIKITGKNASSSGYSFLLSAIWFYG